MAFLTGLALGLGIGVLALWFENRRMNRLESDFLDYKRFVQQSLRQHHQLSNPKR